MADQPDEPQGAGNSIFTLMKYNENPYLDVYATDYSSTAVDVVKVSHHWSSFSGFGLMNVEQPYVSVS